MTVGGSNLSATDLAELLAAFNDVTAKLQASHDHLRAEVARLSGELREANEAVARAQRLAALGEMAAGIAHEVRNPLGGIRLYARMLEEDLAHQPQQAGLAAKITSSARAVEGIVQDVLAFAKELRVRPDVLSAQEAMERALEAASSAGGWQRHGVVVERSQGPEVMVEADALLLHQVLVNVLQNAAQAMVEVGRDRPRVRVSVREQRVSLGGAEKGRGRTRCVLLRVQDDGPGVSQEVIERMFNPFFTTRASGTGLGLAIVHRIVDAHGGRIVVRNNADLSPQERLGERSMDEAGLGKGESSCLRGACVDVVLPLKAIAREAPRQPVPGSVGHEADGGSGGGGGGGGVGVGEHVGVIHVSKARSTARATRSPVARSQDAG